MERMTPLSIAYALLLLTTLTELTCHRGLLVCTAHLAVSLDATIALEKPVHTSIAVLFVAGIALLLVGQACCPHPKPAALEPGMQHAPIPLADLGDGYSSRPASPPPAQFPALGYLHVSSSTLQCMAMVFLLCFRVEALFQVLAASECSVSTIEPTIPILIAVADWWLVRRHICLPRGLDPNHDMGGTLYSDALRSIAASSWRQLIAVIFFSWSAITVIARAAPARSAHVAGALADGLFAVILCRSLHSQSLQGIHCVGSACVTAAIALFVVFTGMYWCGSAYARNLINTPTPSHYVPSAIKLTFEVSLATAFAALCVKGIGLLNTSVFVFAISAHFSLFLTTWNHAHPFPPLTQGLVSSLAAMDLSLVLYSIPEPTDRQGPGHLTPKSPLQPGRLSLILGMVFVIQVLIVFNDNREVPYHPIDMLLYSAKRETDNWLVWASSSVSVESATATYTRRYGRQPPPHFDKWFAYATDRSSVILDDFDSILEDLLPFWSLSPAEIRRRTWEAITDPSQRIGGITIRNGRAQIALDVPHDRRGILDSTVELMDKFVQWLPDMDLAFNLERECRVTVPFEEMQRINAHSTSMIARDDGLQDHVYNFSAERDLGWQLPPEASQNSHALKTFSGPSIWHELGSIACPPGSPARSQGLWSRRDYCASCALPHALGAFLANWTRASDICHQPDIASYYDFYNIYPNSFVATHRLLPIFSQSKAPGFNDIIYPSDQRHGGRIAYAPTNTWPDPPFDGKKTALFWRDVDSPAAWPSTPRQRMVHTLGLTTHSQAIPLPYPVASYRRKLRYAPVDPAVLRAAIPVDVDLSPLPPTETEERVEHIDAKASFQSHWQHRYLLDIDDSPPSDRFLAFLHSRSLPLKVAPLLREWWHDRVIPWLHFVPLDPRLQGLWPTLVFFTGFKGVVDGKAVETPGELDQARRIAEEGRAWSERVLRTEDREVYLFRLLLEWGRMTDDAREQLAFVQAEVPGTG